MGASYRINTNLQVQNSFYISCKFIQTGSYFGYKVLFSTIIIVLDNNKKPTQLGRFLFLQVLKLCIQNCPDILSKFIQTGSYGGYKASHANERLFSFKAASQARLCKLTRMRKAKQTLHVCLKGFG
jgi:hypothetical protein